MSLEITGWAAGGRGLAHLDGRVVFVAGGVPGDRVGARIERDHGRWLEGRVESILAPSGGRRAVACPIQGECGGCPMMPVPEDEQRDAKRRFVSDALARIGRLPDVPVAEVVPAPSPLGYRNKVELTLGPDRGGRLVLGYHRAAEPRALVDVAACAIADPRLSPALSLARELLLEGRGTAGLRRAPPGGGPRVVLRCSDLSSGVLVAIRGEATLARAAEAFARAAESRVPNLAGVALVVPQEGRRGGARTVVLAGRGVIEEALVGTVFAIPAATFFQVNTRAAEGMAGHVVEGAGPAGAILELYAGVGAIGLALARGGARVDLVEADPGAVECGREAAARAGISGARFVRGDVGRVLAGGSSERRPDLVVADPPRTGLGRGVAEGIAALRPGRLAMISCDPATLARDLAALVRLGFRIDRVVPFDLFPQTAHVEAVAWLTGPPS